MACGITSDYIYKRLNSIEKESENDPDLCCALLKDENNLNEIKTDEDQIEVKGGADGR